jgi:hypothetical protein
MTRFQFFLRYEKMRRRRMRSRRRRRIRRRMRRRMRRMRKEFALKHMALHAHVKSTVYINMYY